MNHLRVCLLLLVLLLLSSGWVRAQLLWDRCVGTAGDDEVGYRMIRLRHGGYLLAGSRSSALFGERPYLAKVSEQGDTVWTQTYGGVGAERMEAVTVAENRSGHLLVGCEGWNAAVTDRNALLMLCDSLGQVVWSQPYSSPLRESFRSAHLANDGHFVLVAQVLGADAVWKIDSTGREIWNVAVPFDSTTIGVIMGIQPINSGYVVVVNDNIFPYRNRLCFLNELGTLRHQFQAFAAGGGAVRTAYTNGLSILLADGSLSKIDSTGVISWSNRYSIRTRGVSVVSAAFISDGNYIALGHRYSAGSPAQLDLECVRRSLVGGLR